MVSHASFKHLCLIATLAFAAFLAVGGTQVMKRPDNYKDVPKTPKTEPNPKINIIHKRAGNKVSFAYFTNWGIYGANFRQSLIASCYFIRLASLQNQRTLSPVHSHVFSSYILWSCSSLTCLQIFCTPSLMLTPAMVPSSSLICMLMSR